MVSNLLVDNQGENEAVCIEGREWSLYYILHTSLRFAQAQDIEKKKAEPRTPHLLNLNQDIVAWSQKQKCEVI